MLTKADFLARVAAEIDDYPEIAALYHAGDPRILQNISAMATMLAMKSAEDEVALAEPFEKVRDSTVRADAAMRGIVQKATPARVRVRAKNKGAFAVKVGVGRTLFDSAGNPWRVAAAVMVPGATDAAPGEATFEAEQVKTVVHTHTVTESAPFYAIPIPESDDGGHLAGVAVSDASGVYVWRNRYLNVAVGERMFHVEADDLGQIYVRFGYRNVVGTQPDAGRVITLTVDYSRGDYTPEFGSPFAFEYIATPYEPNLEMTMDALITPGQDPLSMSALRDLARFPSVYDDDAVFLGEFNYLVRRNFPALRFLSVWNETAEEAARGPSLDNINQLFVAVVGADAAEATLTAAGDDIPAPVEIAEDELTGTQRAIRERILAADDSYGVRFFTPVVVEIPVTIHATVSTSYIADDVAGEIASAVLSEFGADAIRRGGARVLYKRVYALLREKVAALESGEADLKVEVGELDGDGQTPEMWRYVSPASLSVTVENAAAIVNSAWR
jgi:hypothetical protein